MPEKNRTLGDDLEDHHLGTLGAKRFNSLANQIGLDEFERKKASNSTTQTPAPQEIVQPSGGSDFLENVFLIFIIGPGGQFLPRFLSQ